MAGPQPTSTGAAEQSDETRRREDEARRQADEQQANDQRRGDGASVRALQQLLVGAGIYGGRVDGVWSSPLASALKKWQKTMGLDVSGEYDAATDQKVKDVYGFLGAPHPSDTPTQSSADALPQTPPESSGLTGSAHPTDPAGVRALQQKMADAGLDPGPVDGIWGPRTQAAYDQFNGGSGAAPADTAAAQPSGTATGAYTPEDLAYYAKQAGFTGAGLQTIVAIAMAEGSGSGGQSTYVDPKTGKREQSYGVVQINVPSHPGYDVQRLQTDPVYAMAAAYNISSGGTDFSQWTTWSHATEAGAAHPAQANLARASQAVQTVNGGYTPSNPTTGTGGGSGGTTDDLPPNATAEQVQAYVEKHYPQAAPFFANDEIRTILTDAARNHLDDTEVEARLRQTNYWQTHGAPSRAFDALIGRDPQGAGQLVEDTKNTVIHALSVHGIQVGDDQAGEIAKQAIRAGWISGSGEITNTARFNQFAANMLRNRSQFFRVSGDTLVRTMDGGTMKVSDAPWASKLDDGNYLVDAGTRFANIDGTSAAGDKVTSATPEHVALPAGDTSAQADALQVTAKKYGVPLSRASAEDWAIRILDGSASTATYVGWVTAQAKGRWAGDPNVTNAIDQGIDPTTYFSSARDHIANLWEQDPNSIDIVNDPRYMAVTQFVDPKTGQRRGMTLGEADQWARDQQQYTQTHAYKSDQAGALLNLKAFVEGRAA